MHNEYHYKWPVLQVTINTAYSIVVTTNSTEKFRALTRDIVMAQRIQVFVQVAPLFYLVTISMGGATDWQEVFSQLENIVNVQQEEIKSLHQMIEQLEKRLEAFEVKGEFEEIQNTNTTCSPY